LARRCGPDLGLVGLDDGVERGRIDVSLLGQDRLQRPHAQLRLGQLRTVLMMVVVVIMLGHEGTFSAKGRHSCG
jgi:hypothetical protein